MRTGDCGDNVEENRFLRDLIGRQKKRKASVEERKFQVSCSGSRVLRGILDQGIIFPIKLKSSSFNLRPFLKFQIGMRNWNFGGVDVELGLVSGKGLFS